MSSTLAIVAVTSGATLSAAGITAYAAHAQARRRDGIEERQMQARFRHERSLHDLDELRSLLDEAVEAMRSVGEVAERPSGPDWVEESLSAIRPLKSRLALRLGLEHNLTKSVTAVILVMEGVENLYARAAIKTEEDEDDFWIDLEYLRLEASEVTDGFLVEAQQTVGAYLAIPEASPPL